MEQFSDILRKGCNAFDVVAYTEGVNKEHLVAFLHALQGGKKTRLIATYIQQHEPQVKKNTPLMYHPSDFLGRVIQWAVQTRPDVHGGARRRYITDLWNALFPQDPKPRSGPNAIKENTFRDYVQRIDAELQARGVCGSAVVPHPPNIDLLLPSATHNEEILNEGHHIPLLPPGQDRDAVANPVLELVIVNGLDILSDDDAELYIRQQNVKDQLKENDVIISETANVYGVENNGGNRFLGLLRAAILPLWGQEVVMVYLGLGPVLSLIQI
jgi:hypothetical protein